MGSLSRFVQCNRFADCHVMKCSDNMIYHNPQQLCIRESGGKLDDKTISVLRYLEGGRLKKMKHQLQMELDETDSDTPMLDTVRDAEAVTKELVDDIEAAIEELEEEDGDNGNDDDIPEKVDDPDPANEV